jgi:hypothetical protein
MILFFWGAQTPTMKQTHVFTLLRVLARGTITSTALLVLTPIDNNAITG